MFYLMKLRLRDFSPHHPPHTSIVAQNTYFVNSMNAFCPNCASVLYLYFVRSGNIYLPGNTGALASVGTGGIYWSLRAYTTSTDAYNLVITSGVNSSSEGVRYVGFSLRCLSTVLDM